MIKKIKNFFYREDLIYKDMYFGGTNSVTSIKSIRIGRVLILIGILMLLFSIIGCKEDPDNVCYFMRDCEWSYVTQHETANDTVSRFIYTSTQVDQCNLSFLYTKDKLNSWDKVGLTFQKENSIGNAYFIWTAAERQGDYLIYRYIQERETYNDVFNNYDVCDYPITLNLYNIVNPHDTIFIRKIL